MLVPTLQNRLLSTFKCPRDKINRHIHNYCSHFKISSASRCYQETFQDQHSQNDIVELNLNCTSYNSYRKNYNQLCNLTILIRTDTNSNFSTSKTKVERINKKISSDTIVFECLSCLYPMLNVITSVTIKKSIRRISPRGKKSED